MLVRPFLKRTWSGGTILVEEWCSWILYADVLQLVEGSTDNRVVAGSSPAIRTSRRPYYIRRQGLKNSLWNK